MKVTDEIREHARKTYGVAMADYLAAVDRAVTDHPSSGVLSFRGGFDRDREPLGSALVAVKKDGRIRTIQTGVCSPAATMRTAWDMLFAADAVRFGWLS